MHQGDMEEVWVGLGYPNPTLDHNPSLALADTLTLALTNPSPKQVGLSLAATSVQLPTGK